MPDPAVDHEIDAIRAVLAALGPLSEKARKSVLEYVARRLDLSGIHAVEAPGPTAVSSAPSAVAGGGAPHIKDFKEQKMPRSANEMAAVVAYYLANLAPEGQRKETVNQKDVETQFKIASFPLPQQVRVTLQNARNAGYFDSLGDGEYRLNAVGHNLVVHAMPRGAAKEAQGVKRSRRVKAKRPKARRK